MKKDYQKGGKPPKKDFSEYKAQAKKQKVNMWGTHAVREAWLNPARSIKSFYVLEQALKNFEDTMKAAQDAGLTRPEPKIVDRYTLDNWLGEDVVHQGLAIDAEPLEEFFVQDMVSRVRNAERSVFVILDQVTDPHNIGAIMRSASAFGAHGIIMQNRHAPEITGTLAKTACGAVDHIPVAYETNLGRAVTYLQEHGYQTIGLDERAEKTLSEITLPAKAVLILGAEGKGMRPHLREQCDYLVRLPTQGAILSLNVSNAAAVALYALCA